MSRSYLTVAGETEVRAEIKRSEFIATIAHVEDGESAEAFVKAVRKRFTDATHNCYAYISDERGNETRFSDDGEPGGTAGQPMLEVLKKRGLMRTAVVVTRYFGGIKLGAGGLVAAYTDGVSKAADAAGTVTMTECARITFRCGYADLPLLEQALERAGAKKADTEYGEDILSHWWAELDRADEMTALIEARTSGRVRARVTDTRFEAL